MVTASDRRVIITTNERDALAVFEATNGLLSLALPMGERLDTRYYIQATFIPEFSKNFWKIHLVNISKSQKRTPFCFLLLRKSFYLIFIKALIKIELITSLNFFTFIASCLISKILIQFIFGFHISMITTPRIMQHI